MLRTRFLAVLAALLIVSMSAPAQRKTLDVEEVLRLVVEQNSRVQIAEAVESQAEALYRQTLGDTKPQIDVQLDPLYGYAYHSHAEAHSAALGLSLSQALSTGAFASLSLANAMSIADGGDLIVQSPAASFVLNQPVLVNRKLFDFRQLSAAKRASEINWRITEDGSLKARNGKIYAAFSLYSEAIGLRRSIEYLEKSLELADQNLRQSRIDLDAGRASETDLLELGILIGLQGQTLLESQYALLQVEHNLANMLGLDTGLASYTFIDTFQAPTLPADTAELVAEARTNNPTVRQHRLSVEQAEAHTILSGRIDAPNLSVALALLPQYKAVDTPTTFGDSFASFFTDGTTLDCYISVGLDIPLYTGGKRGYREQVNAESERIAREILRASLRDVENTYTELMLRQSIIQDRIQLLEKSIELKTRTAADETRKLEGALGTLLRVESARLELLQVENDLWEARARLFLNSLDLLNLSGRSLEEALAAL
jgi:outer membrane protein TolC